MDLDEHREGLSGRQPWPGERRGLPVTAHSQVGVVHR